MTGEELKKRRKDLGFTQEEFARELKVATNTVARWERDERAIPPYLNLALETIERKIIESQNLNKKTLKSSQTRTK